MMRSYRFPIKGSYYYDAADAFQQGMLPVKTELTLKLEADNPHDANAIQIWLPVHTDSGAENHSDNSDNPSELLIGYVPRQLAKRWHPKLRTLSKPTVRLVTSKAKGKLLRLECEMALPLGWTDHLCSLLWSLLTLWKQRLKQLRLLS